MARRGDGICLSVEAEGGLPMKGRLIAIVFLALAACSQGTPYAFRLMVPRPAEGVYLPYWFWKEAGIFDRFTECEQARNSRVDAAREFLARGKPLEKGYVLKSAEEARHVGKPLGKSGSRFSLVEEDQRAGTRLDEDGWVLYPSGKERWEQERFLYARCVPLR